MERSTTHRACVITRAEVWYGNGTSVCTRGDLHKRAGEMLDATRGRFTEQCTIVLCGVRLAELADQSDAIRAAGWEHTRVDAWTLFRNGDRLVAVGVRDAMTPGRHVGVVFGEHTEPGPLAILLDRYHAVTGTAWRGTAAMTALNAIRDTWTNRDYQPLWRHRCADAPGYGQGPIVWRRDPTDDEQVWGWVHQFDARSAYLAAAGNAEVAWSKLERRGVQPFDPGLPGYWLLQLTDRLQNMQHRPGMPPLVNWARLRKGVGWFTTPYARLLHELDPDCWVVDSVTGSELRRANGTRIHPAQARVFRTWAEGLRDARTAVEQWPAGTRRDQMETAVKRTYKDAVGGMQRAGMRIDRPDWGHSIIDGWRATLMRTVLAVHASQGVWPLAVRTDALYYADSVPDWRVLADAIGCRPQLGKYRHEKTVTIEEWQADNANRRKLLAGA